MFAGERLQSNLSRVVVVIWVFVVLILTSSYTASLTSMLTVQQLQPTVTDLTEILKNGEYIGYQDGSFVEGILKGLGFKDHQMKNYSTQEEYKEALKNGSANGGVAAIFDEVPYLKLFLSKHCTDFTVVGKTYKTDGFGFVSSFPCFKDQTSCELLVIMCFTSCAGFPFGLASITGGFKGDTPCDRE